jgi:hypothetical protein
MKTATKLVSVGGGVSVLLLLLNWIFGGWFLKALFSSSWKKLWTPGLVGYIPEGLIMAILLIGVSLLGFGLATIMEDQIVRRRTGSGPLINPLNIVPEFWGVGFFVGGVALIIRYAYLLVLIAHLAVSGVKANFSTKNLDLEPISEYTLITRSIVESYNYGIVGPDTLAEINVSLGFRQYRSQAIEEGKAIPKGALIIGDLDVGWSKYPVRILTISYAGRKGIFESLDSFAVVKFTTGYGSYVPIQEGK